jgi:hypothetical protein
MISCFLSLYLFFYAFCKSVMESGSVSCSNAGIAKSAAQKEPMNCPKTSSRADFLCYIRGSLVNQDTLALLWTPDKMIAQLVRDVFGLLSCATTSG